MAQPLNNKQPVYTNQEVLVAAAFHGDVVLIREVDAIALFQLEVEKEFGSVLTPENTEPENQGH